jgi:serine/threonine protein kinase
MDPKMFIINNSKKNEESDVYSVGVLLWEITSGQPPFYGKSYDDNLIKEILQDLREISIPDTPIDYIKLYEGKENNMTSILIP